MATNTSIDIGLRRFIYGSINDYRNFEPSGQLYAAVRDGYEYQGVVYDAGDAIPFDVGGTSYSGLAQLERDFNSGWIDPAS